MNPNSIKKLLRKDNILHSIILSIIFGISVFHIVGHFDYFKSLFWKPFEVSSDQYDSTYFNKMNAPFYKLKDLYYVTDLKLNTKVEDVMIDSHTIGAVYYTVSGDHIIICEFEDFSKNLIEEEADPYLEEVIAYPIKSYQTPYVLGVKAQLTGTGRADNLKYSSTVLRTINKKNLRSLKVKNIALLVVMIWFANQWRLRFGGLFTLRSYKGIRDLDKLGGLDAVCTEMEKGEWVLQEKGYYFTTDWLLNNRTKEIIKLDDVVWIRTKCHRILTLDFNNLYIYTKEGRSYRFYWFNDQCTYRFLAKLQEVLPWLTTEQASQKLDKWKNHREAFIQEVEEQKQEYMQNQKVEQKIV